ncbi:hypothetical protein EB796_015326 [Bugula neritina]|uniref:Uncharacterized protein n=1 Tax=Bugula neritina TaxID=10212 RepID=A0A7J7JJ46_BUGNE|nr:hypothetical protein EB796_015326 [Bugula neritina]
MGLISTSKDKVEEESDEEDDGEYICDDCDFRTKLLSEWKTHVCHQGTPSPVKTVSEEVIIPQSTESFPTVSSNRGNPAAGRSSTAQVPTRVLHRGGVHYSSDSPRRHVQVRAVRLLIGARALAPEPQETS